MHSNSTETAQVGLVVKNLSANAGDIIDLGSTPESGRSPAGGHGNPLQYSCLENPMDRGAWQAAVHGVAKSGIGYPLQYSWVSLVAQSVRNLPAIRETWVRSLS